MAGCKFTVESIWYFLGTGELMESASALTLKNGQLTVNETNDLQIGISDMDGFYSR
jgi:hypothetical protein